LRLFFEAAAGRLKTAGLLLRIGPGLWRLSRSLLAATWGALVQPWTQSGHNALMNDVNRPVRQPEGAQGEQRAEDDGHPREEPDLFLMAG